MFILIVFLWLLCAVVAAGFEVAYFQRKYKSCPDFRENLGHSLLFGMVGGPVALIVSFFTSGFWKYGWRLWRGNENS